MTLLKNGLLSLNMSAWRRLGEPQYLTFLTDRVERLIAFRPADGPGETAYRVRRAPAAPSSALVSSRALFTLMGVDVTVSRRYPAQADGDMLFIDLKEPGTPVRSNRPGRPATCDLKS